MKQATVLIVEDEPKLAQLLSDYLEQAGFKTCCLNNGLKVIPRVRQEAPDLILLDLLLPGRDGMEICRELRTFSTVPVIMVTARVEEIDRLLGLELGADDYICKPFSPREVVARAKAVLRRSNNSEIQENTEQGFVLDQERYQASLNGVKLELTPVEFRLLSILLAQPGRVYSRDQLLDRLYDDLRVVNDRTIDTHIKNLRKKIGEIVPEQEIIRSVYGVGYKLE